MDGIILTLGIIQIDLRNLITQNMIIMGLDMIKL